MKPQQSKKAGGKFEPGTRGKVSKQKGHAPSLKNQIRGMERLLRKVRRKLHAACLPRSLAPLGLAAHSRTVCEVVFDRLSPCTGAERAGARLLPLACRLPAAWMPALRLVGCALPAGLLQPDLDPKMRARQEAKLEELRQALAEHQQKELERKYATRYHKVVCRRRRRLLPPLLLPPLLLLVPLLLLASPGQGCPCCNAEHPVRACLLVLPHSRCPLL